MDVVLAWLRKRILSGEYSVGERLPPERLLAEQLGVTRNTLRAAMGRLEGEGLLEIRQGSGASVRDFREHGRLGLIEHLPTRGAAEELKVIRGLLELRRGVASEAVALACARADDAQIAELQRLAELQAAETDRSEYILRDVEFTRRVARAADNLPMELLYNEVLRASRSRPVVDELRFEDLALVSPTYQWTVDLIRQRDPDQARSAMKQMLELVDDAALERLKRDMESRGSRHEE
jgi:GntR family transcriptional repressor for pyruvate dehydrogenase complex